MEISKLFILIGVLFLVIGIIWNFGSRYFSFGNLPGDIKIERENFKFYFPLGTSILISLILTLILWLMRR